MRLLDVASRSATAAKIHDFIFQAAADMAQSGLFSEDDAQEGLEKLLMKNLHKRLFGIDPGDAEEDRALKKKICCLQWVTFDHLEAPPLKDGAVCAAVAELTRLNRMMCPRDKLVLMLNTCHIIIDALQDDCHPACNATADNILPPLIYVILKANPDRLHSHIEFTQYYRLPLKLTGEHAYRFTLFSSAVAFIRSVGDTTFLHMAEEEFRLRYAAAELAATATMKTRR